MKKRIRILCLAMLMLSGCIGNREAVSPQPIGTLAAIEYRRSVDMIWGENYYVRVTPEEIESMEYFVEEDRDYRVEMAVSLNEGQWKELEAAALALLPGLTEHNPPKDSLWRRLFQKALPLPEDGADSSSLSFDWVTEDGIISVGYQWKYDDPIAQELITLLRELQYNRKGE